MKTNERVSDDPHIIGNLPWKLQCIFADGHEEWRAVEGCPMELMVTSSEGDHVLELHRTSWGRFYYVEKSLCEDPPKLTAVLRTLDHQDQLEKSREVNKGLVDANARLAQDATDDRKRIREQEQGIEAAINALGDGMITHAEAVLLATLQGDSLPDR
jgi:hypothetical protein